MGIEKMEEMYYLSYITFLGAIMIQTKTYDNGLRIVVDKNNKEKYVSCHFDFKVGAKDEPEGQSGIAHYIEHLLAGGPTKHKSKQELEDAIVVNGAEYNAQTDRFNTSYSFDCLEENFAKVFSLYSERLFEYDFQEEYMEKEKKVVFQELLEEIREEKESFYKEMMAFISDDQIPATMICGTKEDLFGLTKQNCIDFINHNYTAKNLVISVAGNVDISEVEKLVEEKVMPFINQRHDFQNEQVNRIEISRETPKIFTLSAGSKSGDVDICFPLKLNHPKKAVAFSIYSGIMAGDFCSRLMKEIRVDNGLVYRVGFDTLPGFAALSFFTEVKNLPEVYARIRQNLDKAAEEGFSEYEITREKAKLKLALVMENEGNCERVGYMATDLRAYGRVFNFEDIVKYYEETTAEDLVAIAQEIAECKNYAILQSGKGMKTAHAAHFISGVMPDKNEGMIKRFLNNARAKIEARALTMEQPSFEEVKRSKEKVNFKKSELTK